MAFARQSQYRAPNGRTIFDWLTGTGFLAVDAGAFFVALMVLLPWNLFRSPGDLWVAEPLRTWAFVLTFHALLVGAIALARGIVRAPEADSIATQPATRTSTTWTTSEEPSSVNRQTASTLLAQEWARRWIEDDQAEVAEMVQQSEAVSVRQASVDPAGASGPVVWPEAPTPRQSIDAEAILADWLDEQASEYVTPPVDGVDPLRSAAQALPESDIDPELEWKWVEAAASAWIANRDVPPAGNASSNGHA